MLCGFINGDGYEADALKLFIEMQSADEHIRMDEFTVTSTLNLCVKLLNVGFGRQVHAFMVKTSNDASGFAVSSLIDMYSKCGCYEEACRVFEGCSEEVNLISKNAMVAACCREGEMEMALKTFWRQPELNDAVSWNTLISGYVQNGDAEEGLKLFVRMGENGVRWNEHTFASALSACCGLRNVKCAKEIHSWVLKNGLISNPFVSSGIVDVYCKCENMNYAESMLLLKGVRNSFSISSMIVGYSLQGNMEEARRHFDSLTEKNVVVWTALFSGYVKAQNCEALFDLLSEFVTKEGVVTDALILVILLGACALQAALHPGKEIHAYILRMGVQMDKKLISTLVDMYSKCGNMTYAEIIFQNFIERDLVLYNVMIACYAHHGHEEKAILLFEEMLEKGIKPDAVTFVAILSAFRHCGSVEMGEKYFNSMTADYKISPETDHYACMIDLYGRANQLEKAIEFMKSIPTEEDAVILGSFLNACRLNRNAELAGEAEEKLLRLEGNNKARYVQLANVYAAEGNWAEMGRIRKQMRGMKGNRFAGCSWVYVERGIHIFTVGDVLKLPHVACCQMQYIKVRKLKDIVASAGSLGKTIYLEMQLNNTKTPPRAAVYLPASIIWLALAWFAVLKGRLIRPYHPHNPGRVKLNPVQISTLAHCDPISTNGNNQSRPSNQIFLLRSFLRIELMALSGEVGLRLLLCPIGSNIVVRTACCSVGTILPVYSTFKAIESKDENEKQKWLVYWAVYGSFSIAEMFADKILCWFPLYHHVKFAFLVWLQLPSTNGAKYFYMSRLRPFLLRHQARLDQILESVNGEMSQFVSDHQVEFRFVRTLFMKTVALVNQTVKEIIHPVPTQANRAIEGPPESIPDSQSDNED
ncbi:putative pentatricopeptide repeat-containing protein [Citrus sinensis]|uniref:Pentatricopeptide repeat-containing protein n=1 Tax=Citrus sinensis TaxID=2711 RepID=A0ACB8IG95_CITSI|nr:putative pentatricopeptide repeat-containing protein [Citrus sinensis]